MIQKVHCPKCGLTNVLPESVLGNVTQCRGCKHDFRVLPCVTCPKCGQAIKVGASDVGTSIRCAGCGKSIRVVATSPSAPSEAPVSPFTFAGFWRRAAAALIDAVILSVLNTAIAFGPERDLTLTFLPIVAGWIYFAGMESSRYGATLGKMALGLAVTDLAGNQVSFGRATGRVFAKWLPGLVFSLASCFFLFSQYVSWTGKPSGWLSGSTDEQMVFAALFVLGMLLVVGWFGMAGVTEKKQALHDMIAGCLVIRKGNKGWIAAIWVDLLDSVKSRLRRLRERKPQALTAGALEVSKPMGSLEDRVPGEDTMPTVGLKARVAARGGSAFFLWPGVVVLVFLIVAAGAAVIRPPWTHALESERRADGALIYRHAVTEPWGHAPLWDPPHAKMEFRSGSEGFCIDYGRLVVELALVVLSGATLLVLALGILLVAPPGRAWQKRGLACLGVFSLALLIVAMTFGVI